MEENKNKETNAFKCASCGQFHDQLPALGFTTPFYYDILSADDKNSITEISSDFCVIKHSDQTDWFIRTVLTMQINDACENLDYGIWVSLSEKSFNDYRDTYKQESTSKTYFGMICNEIPGYESTLGLHANVNTRNQGMRPEIIPHQSDHPLIKDWENGISIAEAEKRVNEMMKNDR